MGTLGDSHGAVDEAAGDLDGDDGAVPDVSLDELAVLRIWFDAFLAQQIAGRQMNITVILDDVAAQGAFAGTRAAQDEHHLRLPVRRDGGHRVDTTSRTGRERS